MDKAVMDSLINLRSMLAKEINKIVEKGNMSDTELKNAKCAVEVVEMINHIERGEDPDAMYSQRGYYVKQWDDPMAMQSNSYGNYGDQNSYTRGRNMRNGRYMSRDGGYSGDQEYMLHNLEMAMNEAGSEQERRMIGDLINRVKK